jgi:methylase of polypeptide subunit release factors
VTATDINPGSIANIELNAKINHFENKLTVIKADLFPSDTNSKYDVITINPPYTNHPAKDIVEKSVWDKDHLTIKKFLRLVKNYLMKDGVIYLGWADFADFNFIEDLLEQHNFNYQIKAKKSDGVSLFTVYEIKALYLAENFSC